MSKGSGSLILQKIGRAFQTTLLPTGAIDALHTGLHDVRPYVKSTHTIHLFIVIT